MQYFPADAACFWCLVQPPFVTYCMLAEERMCVNSIAEGLGKSAVEGDGDDVDADFAAPPPQGPPR